MIHVRVRVHPLHGRIALDDAARTKVVARLSRSRAWSRVGSPAFTLVGGSACRRPVHNLLCFGVRSNPHGHPSPTSSSPCPPSHSLIRPRRQTRRRSYSDSPPPLSDGLAHVLEVELLVHGAHALEDGRHRGAPQVHVLRERLSGGGDGLGGGEALPVGRGARGEREGVARDPAVEGCDRLLVRANELRVALCSQATPCAHVRGRACVHHAPCAVRRAPCARRHAPCDMRHGPPARRRRPRGAWRRRPRGPCGRRTRRRRS